MNTESGIILKYKKISENVLSPIKASSLATGYDLRSAYQYTVPARRKELIRTDFQIQIPSNYCGRIAPRSGLALNHFTDVDAEVISDFKVERGDRTVQLIFERIYHPILEEVNELVDI